MVGSTLEEIIGGNIARYREASGMTQATLAEKSESVPLLSPEWNVVKRR